MPYPFRHWLITVGGDMYSSSETWQFGVRALEDPGFVGDDASPAAQLLANALATPTQTMFTSSAFNISNKCRLITIKAAMIEPDGKYAPDFVPGIYTYTTPPVGPSTLTVAPQLCITVSLKTAKPRGRAHAGRFFVPMPGVTLGSDGRLSDPTVDAMETVVKTWLQAIVNSSEAAQITIFSELDTGYAETVNQVGIGRVLDTQRRRRRSLDERRTFVAFP